jgi:hypothetical protein
MTSINQNRIISKLNCGGNYFFDIGTLLSELSEYKIFD